MAFNNKKPPLRLFIDTKQFNLLLLILRVNELDEDKTIQEKAIKLKNKLLKYSIPFEDDNKDKKIEVGFYSSEIIELILQFLYFNKNEEINTNYYETLLEYRKSFIEKNK